MESRKENRSGRSILIIDDDTELCELLTEFLVPEGFEVNSVHSGHDGLDRVFSGAYSLVVLDVMLPGMSGFDLLRELRRRLDTPVLMLTAKGEEVDRIVGLEMGADDYLPKPFNPRELLARIRAIMRRVEDSGRGKSAEPVTLSVGDVVFDPGSRNVWQGDTEVDLTAAEFDLLGALLKKAGSVVSREELAQQVLGRRLTPYDRSIDVHISSLRKKLGLRDDETERIRTVRGMGYQYAAPGTGKKNFENGDR